MVGILIVTHADLGQGVIDATELIAGKQDNIKALGLHHGDSVDVLCEDMQSSLKELDEGDGVIVFVDFLGGSPANVTLKCMQKEMFPCVVGVNMPMLLEAVTNRLVGVSDPFKLEEMCLTAGRESILKLSSAFENITHSADDAEDF